MELEVQNLSVSVGGAEIVRNISLRVENKQFVGLIGPNGCGKSTLLKSIYKVLKPTGGEMKLFDMDILRVSPKKLAQVMGVVGQFNELNFDLTVREMVLMGRTPHKRLLDADNETDYQLVEDALRQVGMEDYAERSFLSLSGGERQRVILARALAQQPKFLIMDEPTNHLDIKYQLQILDIVKRLGIGVLAALHDLSLAARYCDYLYVIKNGQIAAEGAPKKVITREIIADVFGVACETYTNPITGELSIAYLSVT